MTRKMKLIALLEVDKINIMSSHGFNMRLLVQKGLASKKDMAYFFTPKKVKSEFLTMEKEKNPMCNNIIKLGPFSIEHFGII